MSPRSRRYRLVRFIAAALALLWCLPVVASAAMVLVGETTRSVSVGDALRAVAAHHAAVCRCANCKGGTDGKLCCCTGARTAAEGLVWRSACDSGTTLAAFAVVSKVIVFPPTLPLHFPPVQAMPVAGFRPWAPLALSFGPAPLNPPPRFS